MGDEFTVDPAQLRRHVASIEAVQARFGAVTGASAAIAADGAAYGLLCGWIAGILEARHVKQDELMAYVRENLSLAADALSAAGRDYESADGAAADRVSRSGRLR
jgi:hypothetical protein